MKLYKYRNLDNLWRILEIIVDKKFYVAHWQELNDPMEARLHLIEPIVDIYMKIQKTKENNLIYDELETLPTEKKLELLDVYRDMSGIQITKDTTQRDLLQALYQNRFSRILSFSKDPFNYLMWSHYSDSHKGIVIEVDFPDTILNQNIVNLHMKYGFGFSNIHYKKELNLAKDYERRFTSLMRRRNVTYAHPYLYKIIYNFYKQKLSLWSYEKEARFISRDTKYLYLDKFHAKITKILIGCKIDSQKESILRSIIKDIHIVKVKCSEGRIFVD
jgi:hypothetical protein